MDQFTNKKSSQIEVAGMINDANKTARFDLSDKNPLYLHCYFQVGTQWQHKQFSSASKAIKIGPSNYDNEIGLTDQDMDKNQAIIEKVDNKWYVMDCGHLDLMKVDGLPKRQFVLKGECIHVLQIKSSFIVLVLTSQLQEQPKLRVAPPTPSEICFSISEADQYPMPNSKVCIIGANPNSQLCTSHKNFFDKISFDDDKKLFQNEFIGMVFKYQENLFFQDFNNIVQVNNKAAIEPVQLLAENNLRIGKTVLKLVIPAAFASESQVSMPKLTESIFSLLPVDDPDGLYPELHIPASSRSMTIGRSSSQSDIAINDKNISRKHAQFIVYPKNMMVFDCGSSNGTFVNGEKITKKTVRPGDIITLGDITFFFCYADDDE